MEYQTTKAGKPKPTAPSQLRSVKRNTIMLHQHKETRHNASVERLQKMKQEKARQEEDEVQQRKDFNEPDI